MEDLFLILSFAIGALVVLSILILVIQYIAISSRKRKKALTRQNEKKIPQHDKTKADNELIPYEEKKIYDSLIKSYQPQGCKFLFNTYLPKNDNETTEIDLLMISSVGIFVFEIKNYIGCVMGDKESRYWTQIKTDYSEKKISRIFPNPIMQNDIHVKSLNSIINFDYPVYSVIVFSDRCTLYNEDMLKAEAQVITADDLGETVESYFKFMNPEMSDDDIELVYNKLYPYSHVSNEVKAKHIQNIQDKYGV